MKKKYRIVQDGNGHYHIQYKYKGLISLIDDWSKEYHYNEILSLDEAKELLNKLIEKNTVEENKEKLKVIKCI